MVYDLPLHRKCPVWNLTACPLDLKQSAWFLCVSPSPNYSQGPNVAASVLTLVNLHPEESASSRPASSSSSILEAIGVPEAISIPKARSVGMALPSKIMPPTTEVIQSTPQPSASESTSRQPPSPGASRPAHVQPSISCKASDRAYNPI